MPTGGTRAKKPKETIEIGGKEYGFTPAPVAVLLMSQLKGQSEGITNMDGAKWLLRSLSDVDAAEVLGRLENGEIEWDDFTTKAVATALEKDAKRPTT